ncbi:hypothetical protein LINPERPRIM_LOCUS24667 [Linum perenne]
MATLKVATRIGFCGLRRPSIDLLHPGSHLHRSLVIIFFPSLRIMSFGLSRLHISHLILDHISLSFLPTVLNIFKTPFDPTKSFEAPIPLFITVKSQS